MRIKNVHYYYYYYQELYLNDIRESEFLSDKRKSKRFFSCRA